MLTIRLFVAVGVGAAIALSFVEPDASKDLRALTESPSDQAENLLVAIEVAPTYRQLTASAKEVEAPSTFKGDEQSKASDEPEDVVQSSPSSPSPEAKEQTKEDRPTKPGSTRSSTAIRAAEQDERKSESSNSVNSSGGRNESKSVVTPTPDSVKPTEGKVNKDERPLDDAVTQSKTPAPETVQNTSNVNGENTEKPDSWLDGTRVSQSPAPASSPRPGTQGTRALERLTPNPNPLLFPTESREVQIQDTQGITLQQALELARRNNRDLEAARLTLERTQQGLQEALGAEFPTISVGAQFNRSESAQSQIQNEIRRQNPSPLNQFLGDNDTVSTTFNGFLQLNYDLLTAGSRAARIRAAREQVRVQELEVERIDEQLRRDITVAYYALQQSDAEVEIRRAQVTDAAQSLRDALLLEQAGLGTRFDVLQAQVQLANAEQDLTRSLSQQRISRRQIAQFLSLPQRADVGAADPIEVAGEWPLSLEQSVVLAYKNRAELEQQLSQRNISEQQRRIALAALRPQVSLSANYNILGVLNDNASPADGLTLGATVQWTLFDGGAARARARQQEANIAIAETNFANQRNQVRFDVEQAFFNLNANARNIQTASVALTQAEESLRLARLRFQAGVGTQTDVINQQTALTQARFNRLTAILDYNRALADLQRAVSNLPNSVLSDLP